MLILITIKSNKFLAVTKEKRGCQREKRWTTESQQREGQRQNGRVDHEIINKWIYICLLL